MKKWVLFVAAMAVAMQVQAQCLSGDCFSGYGKKKFDSGAVYSGQFKNGQINGDGKLRYSDGASYVGQWRGNLRHGKGQMNFKNGDQYKGAFVKSKMHGYGILQFTSGDRYEGQFQNDQKHGTGTYSYKNGDVYHGEFHKDLRHGEGTMTYKNGAQYSGYWAKDAKHGKGAFTDPHGNVYEGDWADGEFLSAEETVAESSAETPVDNPAPAPTPSTETGSKDLPNCNRERCHNEQGVFTYSDGSRYVGSHKNGLPHGEGTIHYANGDRYKGGWAKHAPHGEGTMWYRNGKMLAAEWHYGRPVRELDASESITTETVEVDEDKDVKVWAVIVGVGRYQHLQSLKYTDDDAYRMYAFLKSPEGGALPDEQIKVLIDEDATRSGMLTAMKQVFYKADDNDVVMLYFSGHGLEGAFVPSDYDGMSNRVMHSEITDIFEQCKAKHRIVFADACHSGSMDMARMMAMRSSSVQVTIDKYYGAFSKTKGGTALLLSSKGEETSLEDSGLRQGVFSHFLMKGMKGAADKDRDKVVTVSELYSYVHKEVTKYTASAQTPTITGDYDKRMPVAIVR